MGNTLHPLESEFLGHQVQEHFEGPGSWLPGCIRCSRVTWEPHLRQSPYPRLPEAHSPPLMGLITSRRKPGLVT